jgi:serine O-acetyltransferase
MTDTNDKAISFIRLFFRLCYKFYNDILVSKNSDILCKLPESTILAHKGIGIVINKHASIGENVIIRQNVTIGGRGKGKDGNRKKGDKDGYSIIEDNVSIGCGATILGNITIGTGSIIGAGAVVVKDIPPGSIVVGIPGKVIGRT